MVGINNFIVYNSLSRTTVLFSKNNVSIDNRSLLTIKVLLKPFQGIRRPRSVMFK